MLNDSDAENDDLTVMEIDGQSVDGVATVSLPSGAIMTIDTDSGALTVDPNRQFDSLDNNETAVVTFDYVISDGEGGTDLATATLTLQGDNSAPYAEDDSKTTLPTSPVSSSMMPNDKISGDVIKEKVSLIFRNDRRFSMSDCWISYTNEAA